MLTVFRLKCKELLRFIPALLILVLLQCVMGQMAAVALKDKNPEVYVGYHVEKQTRLSELYIGGLSEIEGINLIKAYSADDKSELFNTEKIHAFITIPASFDDSVTEGTRPAITLINAPGVTDFTLLKGSLTNRWLLLRTKALAAFYFGNDDALSESDYTEKPASPAVYFFYEGPLLQEHAFITPPAFGIPALFLLLAFLHSASFSAGRDNPRWRIRGRRALKAGTLISILAAFIFWACGVLLYALGMRAVYGVDVPLAVVLALLGLAAYAVSAGGLLAYCGVRRFAAWIFVPCLLLNMTIGGGLWNAAGAKILFPAFLPVSAVLSSGSGAFTGAAVLWAQAAGVLLIIYLTGGRKKKALE